jgi:purine-binding chemotaxis protein CheW
VKQPKTVASTQYLSFFLAGEEYAFAILQVREIIEYDTVTRVPGTPAWIGGVINLRGSVLPVIDLAMKLGLPPCVITRRSCIVVVEVEHEGDRLVLGLLADAVGQVLDFEPGDVEPTPPFGTPVHVDYLKGMGRAGKKFVLLLDADKILDTREIALADGVQRISVEEPEPAEAEAPLPAEALTEPTP